MKIVKDCELELSAFPGQINFPEHSLTLLVKATLDISHRSIAKLAAEQLPAAADEYYPDDEAQTGSLYYASDFAYFKPHTDILLSGKCHVPGGNPVPACPVSIQVGNYKKTLAVFGSRYWKNLHFSPKTTEPEPFQKMDLKYERSFGGDEFALNPIGRGAIKTDISIADNVLPVPNIQDPQKTVTSPFVQTSPAGFGPLKSTWELRKLKMGSFGRRYLRTRWPWFPDDLDWSHFNAAPVDQQIKGYLKGDEKLEFENLHVKHHHYKTQLPAIRPRCFSRTQNPQTGKRTFEEIPLKLDTLWVDMETQQLVLTWRGWMKVLDEDCDEVKHLFLMQESMQHKTASIETCYGRFKKSEAAEDAEFSATEEHPDDNTKKKKIDLNKSSPVSTAGLAGTGLAATDEAVVAQELQAQVNASLAQAGVSLESLPLEMQAEIKKQQDSVLLKISDAKQDQVESSEKVEHEKELKKVLADIGVDLDDLPELSPAAKQEQARFFDELGVSGEDIANNAETNKIWTILAAALPKMGMSAENLEPLFQHVKPQLNRLKDEIGANTNNRAANENVNGQQGKASSIPRQAIPGESFVGQDLSNENFSGLELSGCDFSSAILTGANFSGANLENSKFDYANLALANFSRANLSGASLDYADAKGADFNHTNCNNTSLHNAVFEGVQGENSSWKNAVGNDTVFISAILNNSDFSVVKMPGADFESAELNSANFSQAQLDNATFERVVAIESNFFGADITGLRASLKADFSMANFSQSKGDSPIFSTSNFQNADLSFSHLHSANFDRANLQGANLNAANLKQARFIKSNLADAKFIKANLMQATMERANLTQTDIRGSNCYEVEFLNAVLDGLKTDSANLTATKLE